MSSGSSGSRTLFIEGSCIRTLERDMGKESYCIATRGPTKGTGSTTSATEEALNASLMETCIRASTTMEKLMERDSINGLMARSTTVNGFMASSRDTACGVVRMASHISANGRVARPTAMACMSGQTVTAMKASGRLACATETKQTSFLTATFTLGSINMVVLRDMASTSGQMGTLTKECSREVSSMEMESGARSRTALFAIATKVTTLTIKSMGGVTSSGSPVTPTVACIAKTIAKGSERCVGQTVLSTGGAGTKGSSMESESWLFQMV